MLISEAQSDINFNGSWNLVGCHVLPLTKFKYQTIAMSKNISSVLWFFLSDMPNICLHYLSKVASNVKIDTFISNLLT